MDCEWAMNINLKAMLSNAGSGGTIYKDFTPFTTFELMKHVGLYFLDGVSPSPRVEMTSASLPFKIQESQHHQENHIPIGKWSLY